MPLTEARAAQIMGETSRQSNACRLRASQPVTWLMALRNAPATNRV